MYPLSALPQHYLTLNEYAQAYPTAPLDSNGPRVLYNQLDDEDTNYDADLEVARDLTRPGVVNVVLRDRRNRIRVIAVGVTEQDVTRAFVGSKSRVRTVEQAARVGVRLRRVA
jgi:hypothetical protein